MIPTFVEMFEANSFTVAFLFAKCQKALAT